MDEIVRLEPVRKIIHIDMDAFFASVEQLDNPELRGKPVAVGYAGPRGVVAAASYEARKYGVRSALPSKTALSRCPALIFVPPRFERYSGISDHIHSIFHEYTDLVEPLSLDEAYLDVTYSKKGRPSATLLAAEIKQRIFDELHLTASAGVSYNKFLAKVASDVKKPDGLFVITPDKSQEFIDNLDISKFYGIGKVTAKKLNEMGIWMGSDLKKLNRVELTALFGKNGNQFYDICRGIDIRLVEPYRERKSVGAENTFQTDLYFDNEIENELLQVAGILWKRVKESGIKAKTLTLKYKYADFEQHTLSKTLVKSIETESELTSESLKLLKIKGGFKKGIRLLGLNLSNFIHEEDFVPYQLTIDF